MNIEDKPVLSSTSVDLTEGCNLACDYCFTWSAHKSRKMSWKTLTNIIEWWLPQTYPMENSTPRQFQFWGGEPLLEWKTIKKTVKYIQDKIGDEQMEYGGTTNGVLYTPDKVEWCLENKSLFLVSLDGIEEVHDAHRKTQGGKGSWKIVDKNVREALKLTDRQRVRCSLSADNIDRFYETAQYFIEDLGIKHFAFSPVFEDNWNEKALETLAGQFELISDLLIKKHQEGNPVVLKHLNDEIRIAGQGKISPQNPCGAGNGYTCWSVDGYLYPCHRFNKHGVTTADRAKQDVTIARPVGDSFEWIHDEWRQEFIEFYKTAPESCQGCDIFRKSGCKGGCYATNYDMTGSIYVQPKSECDYNHVQRQAALNYKKKLEDAGLELEQKKRKKGESCTCYNMCYCEGQPNEIIHTDKSSEVSCVCYNTNYTGDRNAQYRTAGELRDQKRAEQRIVNAAIKVMKDVEDGKLVEKDSCGPDCQCEKTK